MFKILDICGVKPFGLFCNNLLNDFWFGVDHNCMETIGRSDSGAVVAGCQFAVEMQTDLAAALTYIDK